MNKITLATLPNATKQEVFDHIVRHLLTQMEQALDFDGSCTYRSSVGPCAAGCLIADDEYKLIFEGSSWKDLVSQKLAPKKFMNLIQRLQEG